MKKSIKMIEQKKKETDVDNFKDLDNRFCNCGKKLCSFLLGHGRFGGWFCFRFIVIVPFESWITHGNRYPGSNSGKYIVFTTLKRRIDFCVSLHCGYVLEMRFCNREILPCGEYIPSQRIPGRSNSVRNRQM